MTEQNSPSKDPEAQKIHDLADEILQEFHTHNPDEPMGAMAAVVLDKVRAIADISQHRLDAALKLHDLVFLWNEVHLTGEIMRGIDPGQVFGSMTCSEAQSLADIFAAAGDQKTHDHIMESHAWGDDDPDDEHHARYLELKQNGGTL